MDAMHPLIARFALVALLLTSTTLVAQPITFGDAFPLTNTRYHAVPGTPTLVSNGQELLIFWPTSTNIRVAKVVEGERRGGKSALDTFAPNFSVAWNGTHFLLTAGTPNGIEGRLLTSAGEPVGEPFQIRSRCPPEQGNETLLGGRALCRGDARIALSGNA